MTRHDGPVPTLAQLQRTAVWWWAICGNRDCLRRSPLTVAPFVIRWGAQASSDQLRRNLRCAKCQHRGATLQHPGWVDMEIGTAWFPVQR